jgi:hypothetical protein
MALQRTRGLVAVRSVRGLGDGLAVGSRVGSRSPLNAVTLGRPRTAAHWNRRMPALLLLVVASACTGRPRSEEWMRDHLIRNKVTFDHLVEMSNSDFRATRVTRIAPEFTRLAEDWAWPRPESSWGVSPQRWDEYRRIFKQLRLPAGLDRDGERQEQVIMVVYGTGMAGEGREYGYLWSAVPPAQRNDREQKFTANPILDNWYRYEWVVY